MGRHALDHWLCWDIEIVITAEMRLPFGGHFTEFLLWLALQTLLDFVNTGDGGSNATNLAHVFATTDFLKNPLDHEKFGYAHYGLKRG